MGAPSLGVPPAFPFHMIKLPLRPRGHQLAPWQSGPGLEWAPGTLLYFQEVVKTWAEGGGWLLCRTIASGASCLLIMPKPEPKGMPEVGTWRKWRLVACPEPRSPVPQSPLCFCSPLPAFRRPQAPRWSGPRGWQWGQTTARRVSAVNSGRHLLSCRTVWRAQMSHTT